MDTIGLGPAVSGTIVTTTPPTLRLAVAAYLARFKGQTRVHTESDLRGYLTWCQQHDLDPLSATRPHVELYLRWLQEVRRYRPSTISRRMSVVAGFYRTCVIDSVLEHSPAQYVRRPNVPSESPTLGLRFPPDRWSDASPPTPTATGVARPCSWPSPVRRGAAPTGPRPANSGG